MDFYGWLLRHPFCEIALTWKPQDLTDDKSTLVQVMAWCRQATSQYLSQCWPSSLWPYGVTKPQRVKALTLSKMADIFQTTFWNAYSCKKVVVFWFECGFNWFNIYIYMCVCVCVKIDIQILLSYQYNKSHYVDKVATILSYLLY